MFLARMCATSLVDRYVAMELKEYRRIFRTTDEAGQLDNISRRFSWFLRLLQAHDLQQGRVFPGEWRVGWYLLAKFTDNPRFVPLTLTHRSFLTARRDDLSGLLSKAGSALSVKTLLDNLQLASDFEASMSKKWATPVCSSLSAYAQADVPQVRGYPCCHYITSGCHKTHHYSI